MVKKIKTCNIIKYAKEIKEIAIKEGNGIHGDEVQADGVNSLNNYIPCGNIIIVKADIKGSNYITDEKIRLKNEGCFIIEKNDLDLLSTNHFIIRIRHGLKNCFNLPVFVCLNDRHHTPLSKIFQKKYPLDDDYKYYVPKNNNPLDLRKCNWIQSKNKKKPTNNKTGIIGVCKYLYGRTYYYLSCFKRGKIYKQKQFSTKKYPNAFELAVEQRKEWEEQYL
jgi:hypothetical protein